jgi:tight adherence protein B
MNRFLTLLTCVAVAATLVPLLPATAQDVVGDGIRIEGVDTAGHPDVGVTVSVPVAPGSEPDASAFRVLEGGDERVVTVEPAATADLEVVLAVDTSGSMGGAPIAAARAATSTLLQGLPDDVGVAILTFDSEVEVRSGFSASRDEHLAAAADLVAEGNTSLFDAVAVALEQFSPADEGSGRAIVLLSDGEDTSSTATLDEVVNQLAAAEVTFQAIAYGTASSEIEGLQAMADATGGTVTDTTEPDGLVALYDELAASLVSRYRLDYVSESEGATELTVEYIHVGTESSDTRTVDLPVAEASVPVEPAEAAPVPTQTVETSALARAALLIGAALWFLAIAILAFLVFAPRQTRAQLWGAATGRHRGQGGLTELAARASQLAEHGLDRRGYTRGLNAALERAGINLRPGEFVVLAGSAVVVGFGLGFVLHGPLVGLVLAVITGIGTRLVVSIMGDRRQKRFADQLSDTLLLLSGSLRSGYGLMQAVDSVAREADAPTSEEFGRLVVETRLGRDMNDALEAMAARMGSEDFAWVMQAIEIHREVGGDLAEVLDNVGETIRERNQIRRQVQALSAEGRLSAWVLLALPFGVGGFIYLTNRPYLAELTSGGLLGWGLIGTGVVLMTFGVVWIRNIVKLDF